MKIKTNGTMGGKLDTSDMTQKERQDLYNARNAFKKFMVMEADPNERIEIQKRFYVARYERIGFLDDPDYVKYKGILELATLLENIRKAKEKEHKRLKRMAYNYIENYAQQDWPTLNDDIHAVLLAPNYDKLVKGELDKIWLNN